MRRIFILFFLSLFLTASLRAQCIVMTRSQLEAYKNKPRPVPASIGIASMRKKALAEGNTAKLIRASFLDGVARQVLSPDSLSVWQEMMEREMEKETRPVEKALWNAALGRSYASLRDICPADTLCRRQAAAHFRAALDGNKEELAATPYDRFLPLFIEDKGSRFFGNDLLHILFQSAVESDVWDAKETSRQRSEVLSVYRRLQRFDAVVLFSLDSLAEADRGGRVAGRLEEDERFRGLERLKKENEGSELVAKIVSQMTQLQTAYDPDADFAAHNDSLLVALARQTVKKEKKKPGVAELRNFLLEIENPAAQLETLPQTVRPDSLLTLRVKGKNLRNVSVRVTRIFDSETDFQNNQYAYSSLASSHRKTAVTTRVTLPAAPSYRWSETATRWQAPATPGIYYVELIGDGKTLSGEVLRVTRLRPLLFHFGKEGNRVAVLDSRTGKPLRNFRLTAFLQDENGKLRQSRVIDSKGKPEVTLTPLGGRIQETWFASVEGDAAVPALPYLNQRGYFGGRRAETFTSLNLLADRGIYRPGQKVCVSGVLFTRDGDRFRVEGGRPVGLRLLDVNRKAVDSLSVSSDSLGAFAASFMLPAETLPGVFTVEARSGDISQSLRLRVEDYKRPIFTVSTRPVSEAYQPGDTVNIRGEARTFSGVPLLEARVQFEIRRIGWWRGNEENDVQRGETRTDEQGNFVIPVATKTCEPDRRSPYGGRETLFVSYTVTAESGETVQGSCSLPVNLNAERLAFQVPSQLCRSELQPLTVSRINAAGTGRATGATYFIQPEGSENKIVEEHFTTGKPFSTERWKLLLSDRYWFIVRTDDGLLCDTATFCIFGENDVRPADRRRPLFFHEKNLADGKEIWVGSPEHDACLFFDLLVGDTIKEHRLISLNDSLMRFSLTWKEEYGEGAKALFALLRNDELYAQTVEIPRPAPDKELRLRWSVLRSRLTPGSREEWVLRVENAKGNVSGAAVMARMTDASLEQLARVPWELNHLNFGRRLPFGSWTDQRWLYSGTSSLQGSRFYTSCVVPRLFFTKWDENLFEYRSEEGSVPFHEVARGRVMNDRIYFVPAPGKETEYVATEITRRFMALNINRNDEDTDAVAEGAINAKTTANAKATDEGNAISGVIANALRTDFAETAFFLPALRTNEQGETLVSFTLPESVTSWNVSALAFTSAMDYGKVDTTVVARKEFMVEPSLPRFVRKGDRCTVPVRVTNLSAHPLQPVVTFFLTDAATGKRLSESSQNVTVETGRTEVIHFTLPADLSVDAVCCRVVGEAKNFSDGEEHLLPILTDEVRIEHSLPLTLDKEGVTKLRIDTLLTAAEARHRSLTVELTTHPAWAAVAALPSLTETEQSQSAVEWATRYYGLALGLETLQRCPTIKEMVTAKSEEVEVWAKLRAEGFRDLNPWQEEAERAAAQTRGLKNLFNAPLTDARLATSLAKLRELQTPDGGFGWFPGMSSSPYITSEIVLLLSRVSALTSQKGGDELLRRGLDYLQKLLKDNLKNDDRKVVPFVSDEVALRYLYARALMGEKYDSEERKFVEKLTSQTSTLPMLETAWLVSVLQNAGKKDAAATLGRSIVEHTVLSAEMGRYFDSPRAARSTTAYRIPTQCAAIEALQRLGYQKETEEMRRWLLQTKRTQMWETSTATADAIFALLVAPADEKSEQTSADSAYHIYIPENNGTPLLFTLSHGKKILALNAPSQTDTPKSTGHFKQTFTGNIAREATELKLDKRTPGISFATVSVSAVVPSAQVENRGGELVVSRRVEVKRDGVWFPVGNAEVRVGDRLRLVYVLKATHDFDFVSLQSARPACLQPVRSLSGHVWEGTLDTYRAVQDASTRYFISSLPKGEHVFTEELFADRSGVYSSGIATLSGVFAPEFNASAASFELTVKEAK